MGKPLRQLIRATLYRGKGNLQALDDPYPTMVRLLRQTPVSGVIDAGASDGRVSRRLLELFPQAVVYGFEPHPDYAARLADFARDEPRFRPQAMALADRSGTITLNLSSNIGETSLFTPRAGGEGGAKGDVQRSIEVPVVRLDEWWREQGRPDIQLVKFDIQGAEAVAIDGAAELMRSSVRLVYTEVFFNRVYEGAAVFSDIDRSLRAHGFELHNLFKITADERDRLRWGNAIYVRDLPA